MLLQISQKLSAITLDKYHEKFGRKYHDYFPVLRWTYVSAALF